MVCYIDKLKKIAKIRKYTRWNKQYNVIYENDCPVCRFLHKFAKTEQAARKRINQSQMCKIEGV